MFDPHPNLLDLIDGFHAADAVRPADRPIRLHRAVVLPVERWRFVANPPQTWRLSTGPRQVDGERRRLNRLADSGEHLGLPSMGRVIETVEVSP